MSREQVEEAASPKRLFAVLWMMFAHGDQEREPMQSKSLVDARDREALLKAGLIEIEQRGAAKHVVLTDKAWAWASDHLGSPIWESKRAAGLLERVLGRVKVLIDS